MIKKKKKATDFTVRKSKNYINSLLIRNPKIFIKIDKQNYEQIYIDNISDNGNIIIYDNEFNRRKLSDYIMIKRNLKRTSASLRYVYYSFDDENKHRIYDYLTSITLI